MECKHIIGWKFDYDCSSLITLDDLEKHILDVKRLNNYKKKIGFKDMIVPEHKLEDYFKGKNIDGIELFKYCPLCGKKIEKGE